MHKIALTVAAIFVATGSAFAGSDHYGSNNASQPVVSVDHAVTGSVKTMAGHKAADARMKATTNWPDPGQGIWGN
ncbi:DUF680 domain-containing protein [Mesorhizobium sp. LjRoot246]|uniref:DUF680 domain-containing protein n=1 Tax=Mesorhizobium sp. LjRoot246 TaxID=3342294 RepID=UPI003ECF760F